MSSLFVISTTTFSGKTALIAAMMEHLRREGYRIGYLKPVSTTPDLTGRRHADSDAEFIKRHFDLPYTLDELVPVRLTASTVEQALHGEIDFHSKIKAAYDQQSADADVIFIEGCGDLAEGSLFGLSKQEIADLLDLPVVIVTRYIARLTGDDLLLARHILGKRLIGAVINAIPSPDLDLVRDSVVPILNKQGVPVLGLLPRQRLLIAATVLELAEGINGEILVGDEHAEALVENLTIGAMSVANALKHFRRRSNKAVITGGDRSDIQLAALETSTRCLILTGNLHPSPAVTARAEQQGVPIILSPQSTLETVETINQFFGRTRFHQAQKLEQFLTIFEEAFDFVRLYKVLGLKS